MLRIVVAAVVLLAGCLNVPPNVVVDIERHHANVERLHDVTIARLKFDIAVVESQLSSVAADDPARTQLEQLLDELQHLTVLARADKVLSSKLQDWARKHANEADVQAERERRELLLLRGE